MDPIPMILACPMCGMRHIDRGEYAMKPHHTHACQECGNCWRPAIVPTVGVRFLPGFKDDDSAGEYKFTAKLEELDALVAALRAKADDR